MPNFRLFPPMSTAQRDNSRAQILVVEDSSVFREMQGLLLRQAGFGVWLFEHPSAALAEAAKQRFDLVVIDYELPEMNGEQFMHALRSIQPDIAVVFVSGSLTLELAIKLGQQGVAGIFNKPANPKTLLEKINETLSRAARDTSVRTGSSSPLTAARATPATPGAEPQAARLAYEPHYVFGASDAFREFTHRLWKVRDFRSVLLLQGEPGSPFDLFAHELADISLFREGPTMVCAAAEFETRRLIEVLAPSLLSQDAGTLVVNGVEDFTAEQQQILENLTTGRDVFLPFARRFRVILTATARLAERVEEGSFGETLYYKISSLSLTVPTLEAMRSDITENARHLLKQQQSTFDASVPTELTPAASAWLEAHSWTGNYAQLARTLILATKHAEGTALDVAALEAGWKDYGAEQQVAEAASVTTPSNVRDPSSASLTDNAEMAFRSPVVAVRSTTTPALAVSAPGPAELAGAPEPVLVTKSLFRPASTGYNFGKRLAESIAIADACGV